MKKNTPTTKTPHADEAARLDAMRMEAEARMDELAFKTRTLEMVTLYNHLMDSHQRDAALKVSAEYGKFQAAYERKTRGRVRTDVRDALDAASKRIGAPTTCATCGRPK